MEGGQCYRRERVGSLVCSNAVRAPTTPSGQEPRRDHLSPARQDRGSGHDRLIRHLAGPQPQLAGPLRKRRRLARIRWLVDGSPHRLPARLDPGSLFRDQCALVFESGDLWSEMGVWRSWGLGRRTPGNPWRSRDCLSDLSGVVVTVRLDGSDSVGEGEARELAIRWFLSAAGRRRRIVDL